MSPPVFVTKSFLASPFHRWELVSTASNIATATGPAAFEIHLKSVDGSSEVMRAVWCASDQSTKNVKQISSIVLGM